MHTVSTRIAVDVGNSRIKLGRFERAGQGPAAIGELSLPEPTATVDLPLMDPGGRFDADRLAVWCGQHVAGEAVWLVASVHRGGADRLARAVADLAANSRCAWPSRRITHRDVRLPIRVDQPDCVGIDRLVAALAADRLRHRDRAAIIVDVGTAITVDLLDADGAFAGGAILPGIAMSARALAEQTDALPRAGIDCLELPPQALGKATVPAIESGLFWGAVGAIRELAGRLSVGLATPPDVFLTGGASPRVAELLAETGRFNVRCVPHLVLSGIALCDSFS